MNEQPNTSSEMQKFIETSFDKMLAIRSQKVEDIMKLFNLAGKFGTLFEKIKNKNIITKGEQETLLTLIDEDNSGLFSCIHNYVDSAVHDGRIDFTKFILAYPYVVDADRIIEAPIFQDIGILAIEKNNKKGLIQRISDSHIHEICSPKYRNINSDEQLMKDGCVVVQNEDGGRFLIQLKKDEQGRYQSKEMGMSMYTMLYKFDRNNMAFVSRTRGGIFTKDTDYKRGIIQRNISENGEVTIQELISPQLYTLKGNAFPSFDAYNQMYATLPKIGKVVLRKFFLESGKCVCVNVFKKGWGGKETKIDL